MIGFRKNDRATLLVAVLLLMANCAGFLALWFEVQKHNGAANLWAMMWVAVGALSGFLFAVPRVNPAVKTQEQFLPNANIEAISDWLTKILVGVGLVNLDAIGRFLTTVSARFAAVVGIDATTGEAATIYFLVVGLIEGYVLTRLFLAEQFERRARLTGGSAIAGTDIHP